jgi:localization factor PodJL
VQQTLQLSGFDPGPIDGLMGARTRRAIEAFERAEGLEPTGRITFALLDQLQQDQSR